MKARLIAVSFFAAANEVTAITLPSYSMSLDSTCTVDCQFSNPTTSDEVNACVVKVGKDCGYTIVADMVNTKTEIKPLELQNVCYHQDGEMAEVVVNAPDELNPNITAPMDRATVKSKGYVITLKNRSENECLWTLGILADQKAPDCKEFVVADDGTDQLTFGSHATVTIDAGKWRYPAAYWVSLDQFSNCSLDATGVVESYSVTWQVPNPNAASGLAIGLVGALSLAIIGGL